MALLITILVLGMLGSLSPSTIIVFILCWPPLERE